jgi:hypothetical protein
MRYITRKGCLKCQYAEMVRKGYTCDYEVYTDETPERRITGPADITENVMSNTLNPQCPLPELTVIEGCEGCRLSCACWKYLVDTYGDKAWPPKRCPFEGMTVKFPEGQ